MEHLAATRGLLQSQGHALQQHGYAAKSLHRRLQTVPAKLQQSCWRSKAPGQVTLLCVACQPLPGHKWVCSPVPLLTSATGSCGPETTGSPRGTKVKTRAHCRWPAAGWTSHALSRGQRERGHLATSDLSRPRELLWESVMKGLMGLGLFFLRDEAGSVRGPFSFILKGQSPSGAKGFLYCR